MRAFICMIITIILLASTLKVGAKTADHWYIRHSGNNQPPVCDNAFSYFENYNVYYMDAKAAENAEEKTVYLTFDAGYENGNIAKILDILKEENVPGAFFVLKNLVVKNKDLLMRMAKEGHLICNHTANHKNMAKATREEFETELKKMEDIYREVTGKDMAHFYRPPEGNFVEENLAWADEMGYATILWSYAYADWDNDKQPDPEYAKKKIYDNIHNGAIVLLHPTSATNVAILKEVIQTLKAQGYRFASLTELK